MGLANVELVSAAAAASSCVTYPFDTACPGPGHPHSSHPRLDLNPSRCPRAAPQSRSQPPPLLSPAVEGTVVAMVHLDDGRMDLKAITLPVRPQVLAYPWHHLRVEALIAHHPRSSCPRAMTHRVVPVVSLDDGRLDLMAIALPVRNAGITQRPRVRPIYPGARRRDRPQPHVVDFEGSKAAKKTSSKPTGEGGEDKKKRGRTRWCTPTPVFPTWPRPSWSTTFSNALPPRPPIGRRLLLKQAHPDTGISSKATACQRHLRTHCLQIGRLLLKRARPDTGISSKATAILVNDIFERIAAAASNRPPPTAQTARPRLNSFVNDIFERIAAAASKLAAYSTNPPSRQGNSRLLFV
ncbi:hypothetical protein EDB84DRAFT_1617404 [Lactarius hengduanensis]|nr:hypothetical protein EDB84DRAFT_1617404 [Lactarius hengduanensis]